MQLEILETTICILCLEYKERMPCDSEGSLNKIVSILCRHFWFDQQVARNQFVCRNCWRHVEEFQRFYKKVLRLHARAEIKQNSAHSSLLHAPKHEELNIRENTNVKRPVNQLGLVSDLIKDSPEVYPIDYAVANEPAVYSNSEPTRRIDRTVSYDYCGGLTNMCCRLKCAECGMTCTTVSTLRTHLRTVHNMRIFMDCCGRHFRQHTRPQNYAKHNINTKTITDKAYYKCEDCDRNFTTYGELSIHREQHKQEQQLQKSPQCSECSKSFASEASVKRHMETVHGPERYICDVCSKAFKALAQLRHHQKIHHEPSRGVECKICRKWLKNLPNLSKHMQRHGSSAKQNICDICGKTSPNASALKAHKKFVHMKEKSFLCAICGKAFKRAVTLKEHLTTHTGGFLYSCPYCSKKFNSNANMHSHKKKMHPSEWEHSRKQYENRFKEVS
ncbi:transcription factor grauzone-like [Anopheles cruzii]|uniref:transcription factor grauzone-like n=1 Tax=Anopheles cruzii TaxID=68878 RepID=UPI0022EC8572|nr:transcription factor grauzone-like [Anopheles cruzii]